MSKNLQINKIIKIRNAALKIKDVTNFNNLIPIPISTIINAILSNKFKFMIIPPLCMIICSLFII